MAFKLNIWISGWSTKKDTLSQQVLSEIVDYSSFMKGVYYFEHFTNFLDLSVF